MDAKQYGEFVRCIELQDIFLVQSNVQREWFKAELPSITVELKSNPELIALNETEFNVKVNFIVMTTTQPEQTLEKENILTMTFSYNLLYSITGFDQTELSPKEKNEILELFCKRNVPINIWPYAREYISSMTVRMGFPALIIGTKKTV